MTTISINGKDYKIQDAVAEIIEAQRVRNTRLEVENKRLNKGIDKNPHYSAIDATVCSDLVLREAERTYRVIDATRDTLKKGG